MYRISSILLAGLASLAYSSPAQIATRSDGIVNGSPASWHDWPFIVDLQVAATGTHNCGGTILDNYSVLTAAHCCFDPHDGHRRHPSFYAGHVGSNETKTGGAHFYFHEFIVHPDYDGRTTNYDFAILKTRTDILNGLGVKGLQYAYLPHNEHYISSGSVVQAAGWGAQYFQGPPQDDLLQTILQVEDRHSCSNTWSQYGTTITHAMFCANTTYYQKGTSTCQGDSGGPIVNSISNKNNGGLVVGVVSFGHGCSADPVPLVFANVFYVKDWILSYLG